ncbi:MAG: hypothetical protein QM296_06865 [Bacillota bacterium]|nr:hypothetical protein [Bacillota bacterium]
MLLARKQDLFREIMALTDVLWGNVLERYTTCSRPNCRCHQGERHGPRFYLVTTEEGRQRQRYLPVRHASRIRKGAEQRRQLEAILQEITEINLALMKEEDKI